MNDKKCENCLYLIEANEDGIKSFDCIKGKHSNKIEDYTNYSCNYWRLKE